MVDGQSAEGVSGVNVFPGGQVEPPFARPKSGSTS